MEFLTLKTKRIILILFIFGIFVFIQYKNITNVHQNVQESYEYQSLNNTFHNQTLYIITPTYQRVEQIPELVRLSQTLMLVPNLVWLVIEDSNTKNRQVEDLLKKKRLNYYYMIAPMPMKYKWKTEKPKGVSNRNKGLEWLRENAKSGVFYFADDDNTYDIELFEEIRKTKTVSFFPVGLVTHTGLSTPIVENCTLTGFYDGWYAGRKFPVDMAGFAVSVDFLLQRPKAVMPYTPGYEEDGFLKSLNPFNASDAQLLADCCTKILVWHTKSVHPKKPKPIKEHANKYNIKQLNKIIG